MSAFLELGSGEAILCFGASAHAPSPTHTLLAAGRRIILSEAPASAIAGLVEELGVARFDILAEGQGAATALTLALVRPDRVGAIVLAAPSPVGPEIEARLGDLATPVLTLLGADGDAGNSLPALKRGHLMYVYDAGADMLRGRPEALAFIVREFFERRELFIVTRESGELLP